MARAHGATDADRYASAGLLIWQLGKATMRLAISVGQKEDERMVETFKRMTVRELCVPDGRTIVPRRKSPATLDVYTSYVYDVYMRAHSENGSANMITLLSVVALFLVAITMGLSLAHALEFPGKLRLDEATYRSVQAIYYPGFTIGGLIGELGGMITLIALLILVPTSTERFWWVAAALGFLLVGHATYWVVTHPVNAAWLKDTDLSGMSGVFFGLFSAPDADWRHMRDVWEYSHVARAGLHILGFFSMTLALVR